MTDALAESCRPFLAYLEWVEALAIHGDIGPIYEDTVVCQLSGGGGHDALRVGDFRRLRDAYARAVPAPDPDDVGF